MIEIFHKLYHDYEIIADVFKAIASTVSGFFGIAGIVDSIAGTTYKTKITTYVKTNIKSLLSRFRGKRNDLPPY
jgi:hypothetical protein